MSMIRLTLPDGTRTQLDAFEITDVEPVAGGSLIHRAAGEPIKVLQDARTIQTRINAELDSAAAEDQEVPARMPDAEPAPAAAAELAIEPARIPVAEPTTRIHRLKRLMQGRASGMALTISQTAKV